MKSHKILIVLISLLFVFTNMYSQNEKFEYSAQIALGKRSYNGDIGNGFFNYDQPFYGYFNMGLTKYINKDFDLYLGSSIGSLGHWQGADSNFLVRALNASFEGRYKLNNGYILREDIPIRPFVSLGVGITGFFPVDDRGDFSLNIGFPLGAGIVYPLNEKIEIFGHWRFIYNSGDSYDNIIKNDNNDHFMSTEIGVKYNFSIKKEKDTDGDGILDKDDKCPKIKGIRRNHGCPKIKPSTKDVFREALRGIRFEQDKAIIKPTSYLILDKIVRVMDNNEYYYLLIAGHTSSLGSAKHNLDLSKRRALAVKKYLVDHGISAGRMGSVGYGESVPVSENKSKEGRALNRRVEFTITFE